MRGRKLERVMRLESGWVGWIGWAVRDGRFGEGIFV